MFDYRPLTDPTEVLAIAQSAFSLRFPERRAAEQWLASELPNGRELYGVYEGDLLLSAYMLYDFRMRLREAVVSMGGIGLLCSRLDARGKGAVRHMLTSCLQTMKGKGQVVSVLDPFDESFYRKYGWEKFSRLQRIEFSPGLLQIPGARDERIICADLSFPDSASMAFYNDYASRHHTLAQRAKPEWDDRTRILEWSPDTAARGVVRFTRDNEVVGLLGYDLSRKTDEYKQTFTVNLLATERDDVLREMLRYLKRLSHQVSVLRISLPTDHDLWPYLTHRPDKWTIRDVFMIRVVSMMALDGLAVESPDMSLGVDVEDQQAPWNHGVWELSVDSGVLHVRPGTRADLRCGIGPVSSVLSGFSSFRELISARLIEPLETYHGQDLP
ncbi:enhanced intracellular survival protein Eis, partial [Candidatus Bipolaricaulota bacterium]